MPTKDNRPSMPALPEGRLVAGVTVSHVDKPDLVWLSAAPTQDSERLLQQVWLIPRLVTLPAHFL